jgi:hypothetical protein
MSLTDTSAVKRFVSGYRANENKKAAYIEQPFRLLDYWSING